MRRRSVAFGGARCHDNGAAGACVKRGICPVDGVAREAAEKALIPLTKSGDWTIVATIVRAEKNQKNRPHPLGGFAAVTLRFIPQPRWADSISIAALPELSGSVQQLVSPAPGKRRA